MTGASGRRRADILLVERGVFESRARARAAIEAGLVQADGVPIARPSDRIAPDSEIAADAPHPWVSRGGVKLAAALDAFAIDIAGRECLDVGASTGGFTDVLLARGARRVVAVDVGRGQLHPKLADDPRVSKHEGTDARDLTCLVEPCSMDIVTVDVSFISLRLVVPKLAQFMKDGAQLIALVKPQFEVGRDGIGKGGIVRDADKGRAAVGAVVAAIGEIGLTVLGTMPSPIPGGDGNREVLVAARRG